LLLFDLILFIYPFIIIIIIRVLCITIIIQNAVERYIAVFFAQQI